jgi:hypothetical protein
MKTLAAAWQWYESTQQQLSLIQRLAEKYWNELPWDGRLDRDDAFLQAKREKVIAGASLALAHLNDLAILTLFSVFEARVRDHVAGGMKNEAAGLQHLALRQAAREMLQRIEEGSFFRVLEPFNTQDADLVELVNQVRRYRNRVAHGRRESPPIRLTPGDALARLQRFLSVAGIPAEGLSDPGAPP